MTPGPDTPSHTGHPSADTLLDLLERWEEEYRLGRDVPAEELCPDRPDLHGLLRQRIARRKRLLGMLRSGPGGGGGTPALPQVPGYEVRRVLGRGGVGVVYEAVAVALGRPVALKMLSALSPGEAALARFRAEGQALAKLRHPNIVQVYEVGTHAGLPYMALELLDESLADRLREAPLPPGQAAALAEVLARAVRHAHRQGILHRDLKPGNVLLRTERDADTADPGSTCRLHALDCTPKVADFGLARLVGEERGHTRTGDLLGTPSYMAPEQAGGSPDRVGPAADVYALGAILYECLTGRPPFRGATALDTLHQIRCDEPVPPRSLQPKVPRDLETVCLKCLEKDPAKRYPSAAALADDLRRFLDGKPVRARPVSPVARAWKWARRRPAAAGLVAVSVLAVAAVLGVGAAYNARLQGALDVARGANRDLARSAYAVFATGDQTRLTPPTRRMVEAAVRSYEGLLGEVSEPAERADLLDEVGMLLFILNRDDGAEETFRRAAGAMRSAVATREQLLAEDPGDPRRRAAMAGSLYQLGDLLAAHSDT
ncbi:MAG TPA: serine/threonine-protein kinase, partial [Gemmataceae bacterium]